MSQSIYKPLMNVTNAGFLLLCVLLAYPLTADSGPTSDEPCCAIPHDTYIDCDDLPYNFDPGNIWQLAYLFGSPNYSSHYHCPNYTWTELPPIVDLNTCEVGTITRRFQSYSYGSWGSVNTFTCQQVITIRGSHNYEIRFPADEVAYCSEPQPEDILYNELACDLLAVSKTDQVFNTASAACYKIFRTYKVINWCEYDGISAPVVISRDEDCDGVPGDEAVWVLRRPSGQVFIDRTNNENDYNPSLSQLDFSCTHNGNGGYWRSLYPNYGNYYHANRGYWQYTQHIKVTDDILPQVHFTPPTAFCSYTNNAATGCAGPVQIPFTVTEECSDIVNIQVFIFTNNVPVPLTPQNNIAATALHGSFPNYTLSGSYPLGQHSFKVLVKDGCGNTNAALIPFKVVDCLAPSPTCIVSLSSTYMPVIPAADVDGDGDEDDFMLELWATDFIASPSYDCSGPITYSINRVGDTPARNAANIIFTCDDGNYVEVEVYAWDSAYNPHAVQPNGTHGGPNYSQCVTFITFTPGDCAPIIDTTPVDTSGIDTVATVTGLIAGIIQTEVDSALMDVAVRLTGLMEDTMMTEAEGLFEFLDLPMGSDYTVTPEKDGDDLNGVTSADLVILAMHLFGLDTIDSPYLLIAADIDSSGFIDTDDYRALRRLVLGEDTELTDNSSWRFVDADYQFPNPANPWASAFPEMITMEHFHEHPDSLAFIAIKIGDLNHSAITESRVEEDLESRSAAENLVLQAADRIFKDGEKGPFSFPTHDLPNLGDELTLEIDREENIELYQNRPNPFRETTTIGYYLPKDTDFQLHIYGTNGKLLKRVSATQAAGYHEIELYADELAGSGLLFYTLTTAEYTLSKRMMIVK